MYKRQIDYSTVPYTTEAQKEEYTRAVAQALRDTDGLMIFDIVHIINRGWWSELAAGIAEGSN